MSSQIVDRLAVHSFCFRSCTSNEQVIGALQECDAHAVELSRHHLNPLKEAEIRPGLKLYKDAGITVTTMGVVGVGDEQKARRYFEFAKLANFTTLPVEIPEGGHAVAEKLCAEYGITVGVHNHGRKDRYYGSVAALESLFSKSSSNIGLCLDTAWMLDSGEDPVEVAKKFKDRLYSLHIKDFVFDKTGKPSDAIVGEGNLKLDALNSFLMEINYQGTYTLEYEGDIDNPVPATKACVEAIRASFERVGS